MNSKISIFGLFALLSLKVNADLQDSNGENINLEGILDRFGETSCCLGTTGQASIPKTFTIDISVGFDRGAETEYRGTVVTKINSALSYAAFYLKKRGPLVTAFKFNYVPGYIRRLQATIIPRSDEYGPIQAGFLASSDKDVVADVYLTFVKPEDGFTYAVSSHGSICNKNRTKRGVMVGLQRDDMKTGLAIARSVALLMGIEKDTASIYPDGFRLVKTDRFGNSCADIGSIMDEEAPFSLGWSTCNLQEFYSYWKENKHNFCLESTSETLTIVNSA